MKVRQDSVPRYSGWQGTVNYGDGTGDQLLSLNNINSGGAGPATGQFNLNHAYTDNGTFTVTVTDKDGATGIRVFNMHVDARLVSIVVTPSPAALHALGATMQFTGVATFSDGTSFSTANIPAGDPEAPPWFSSNPAVATVDTQGRATAVGLGVTTIGVGGHGGSCSDFNECAILTVSDNTPPTVGRVADITVEATGPTTPVNFALPGASDDLDPHPAVSADHVSGEMFPVGTTTVTVTATDASANASTTTFQITVTDTTAPTLTLPTQVTVDATSAGGAVVTYGTSAVDIVSGGLAVTCTPPSGHMFPIGTSTVSCTAVDGAGNSVGGSFEVLVQAAAAQVANLIATVRSFNLAQGIENSLDAKLQNVLNAMESARNGSAANVCHQLGAFINETMAASGKKLTVEQADQLIATARQIQAVIGCR